MHNVPNIEHYNFSPVQQMLGLCPAEDCEVEVNYSKSDCQAEGCHLNFEDLPSKNVSSCSPKLFSMKSDVDIPSSSSYNAESSLNVNGCYGSNPVNDDNIGSLDINVNYFNDVSLFNTSNKRTNEKSDIIGKESLHSGNVQYQNLNKCLHKCLYDKMVPLPSNKTPAAINSKGVLTIPPLMHTVSLTNSSENLSRSFHDGVVFKPSRYLPYSARNIYKKNTLEKIPERVPVSIKARNAKFLCSEKDLRSWTVRELLETCETIQENTVNKEAFSDGRMMTGLKSASNCNQSNAQESFPVPFIINNQSEFCEENLFKINSKNFDEMNNRNVLSSGINSVDPTLPETSPFDYEFSNPKDNPERLFPMQNFEDFGSLSNVSVKIYQPTSDYQKFMKSKHVCEKKIPRPKHFDFSFLQIRNFKYFCKDGNFKRIAKLKVIFSKKKLVYEFQVGETADSSGSYTKHLAIIEVDFHTIVAIWGQEDKFRLQVKVPPHMYVGTRFCKKNQNSSVQNVQYDRCHTTDLTCGELYRIPFHYLAVPLIGSTGTLDVVSDGVPTTTTTIHKSIMCDTESKYTSRYVTSRYVTRRADVCK
uniref:Uncharacterized protein n=1 Tax=Octopus bimaculoides TaxID=37653 RepID=A0A0L8GA08_OCTBM